MIQGKWTAHKNADGLKALLPRLRVDFKRAIGLDFGESCGLALCDFLPGQVIADVPVYLDLLDLTIGTFDSSALRFLRLESFLEVLNPGVIFFEDVRFSPSMDLLTGKPSVARILARAAPTTEFFGALKYYVQTWAERREIPCKGYGIGEIKKYATGKGNASKVEMVKACNTRLGTTFNPDDCEKTGADDMADAAFALTIGIEQYAAA